MKTKLQHSGTVCLKGQMSLMLEQEGGLLVSPSNVNSPLVFFGILMVFIIVMVVICVSCWNLGKRSVRNSIQKNGRMVQANFAPHDQNQISMPQQSNPQLRMNYPTQLPQKFFTSPQQMLTPPPQQVPISSPQYVANAPITPSITGSGIPRGNQNDYHYQ